MRAEVDTLQEQKYKMVENKLKKQIKKILGTTGDISWDVEKEKGRKSIINVQTDFKKQEPFTDMDWDMAMNVPSTFDKLKPLKQTGMKVRLSLELDDNWNVIKSKKLR